MKICSRIAECLVKSRRRRKVIYLCWRSIFRKELWSTYIRRGDARPERIEMGREPWHIDYCADPFLFRHDGANWLFYETLDGNDKGVLGCFKEVDGKWIQQGKVLEEPFHLSYPQVFEEDGRIYMIPESSDCQRGGGGVYLYEATDFPMGWRRCATLINQPSVDSTLCRLDGHYYLACMVEGKAQLWHSETLDHGWRLHPQSKNINSSRRLRRNGGAFLRTDLGLWRIAQDCNGSYGKRVYKIPVLEISPVAYSEGPAQLLLDRNRELCGGGRHTYNRLVIGDEIIIACDQQEYRIVSVGKMLRTILDLIWRVIKRICRDF